MEACGGVGTADRVSVKQASLIAFLVIGRLVRRAQRSLAAGIADRVSMIRPGIANRVSMIAPPDAPW